MICIPPLHTSLLHQLPCGARVSITVYHCAHHRTTCHYLSLPITIARSVYAPAPLIAPSPLPACANPGPCRTAPSAAPSTSSATHVSTARRRHGRHGRAALCDVGAAGSAGGAQCCITNGREVSRAKALCSGHSSARATTTTASASARLATADPCIQTLPPPHSLPYLPAQGVSSSFLKPFPRSHNRNSSNTSTGRGTAGRYI